ncbi:hypothetical protein EAF04_008886 [Stromatinia cepivora]|nr:hypothetical protein EAF04_008886 [Stromatinia cepivora]
MDITLIKSPEGNITGGIYFTYDPSGETFGYYGRSKCHDNISDIGPWILQMIFILGAPTFLAATVYMILARLTVALGAEGYSMIRPRWLTKIYVLIDIICFISQFAGAGAQASGDAQVIFMGNKVILGGLIFQIIAFCFFLFMAWRIAVHFGQNQERYSSSNRYAGSGWKKYFRALYAVSVLLIIRNLVCVIEYAQQVNSGGFAYATRNDDGSLTYIGKHTTTIGDKEVFLYLFDASLMFLVILIFLIIHPGEFTKDARAMNGKRLSSTEMEVLTK